MKIGSDVGWSAKGNGYGTVKVPQKLCAAEVKFVYKSGHVACRSGECITPAHVTRYMWSHSRMRACAYECVGDAGISNFGCKGSDALAIHLSTSNKVCKNKCSIAPFKGMLVKTHTNTNTEMR